MGWFDIWISTVLYHMVSVFFEKMYAWYFPFLMTQDEVCYSVKWHLNIITCSNQ